MMKIMNLKNKTMLIVSNCGYPFGGGEDYLYQSSMWAIEYGMKCYWISFSRPNNKKYNKFKITIRDEIIFIEVPGGFDKNNLFNWIRIIRPNIIHHQGSMRKEVYDVTRTFRINLISGIHFWNGIIDLDHKLSNIEVLKNYRRHKPHKDFTELSKSPYIRIYSVSKYVTECVNKITGIDIKDIVYSGSSYKKCLVPNNNPVNNKYVTAINIHRLKGGEIILYLLKELIKIPFIVIRTEDGSKRLDEKIKKTIYNRNLDDNCEKSIYYNKRVNDIREIYSQTRIFLAPSIVDETFCRTVNEAMMNSIPIITSGRGNIKYLVGDDAIILDVRDMVKWKETLMDLYSDNEKIRIMSEKMRIKYMEHSEEICKERFINLISETLKEEKENNIMIFAPWCDQGLGIQSRNYYKILKDNNFKVYIFSYKPYHAKTAIELQKNIDEWKLNDDNIYYSPNDREHVKDTEIISFLMDKNIGKCIIPETCFHRVFEIAKLLSENDVKCYAIPNIEIVRKDEMDKHRYFHKILCNNYLCQKIFNSCNIHNTEYISYGIIDNVIMQKEKNKDKIIKFLLLGGMNAFLRKQILEVCEAFTMAYDKCQDISLTCTIQKISNSEINDYKKIGKFMNHEGIKIIQSHLQYSEILELYYSHDIVIQVSKHEGLGLGFYEAISTGTPVITLNTPPHNEVIIDNVNGWIIPSYYKKMTENPKSYIESSYFDPKDLCDKMIQLANNREIIYKVYETLKSDFQNRLSPTHFVNRFINALRS